MTGLPRIQWSVGCLLQLFGATTAACALKIGSDATIGCESSVESTAQKSRLIISNPDKFAVKLNKFAKDGQDKLLVISDFDYTLTPFNVNGSRGSSSHGLLSASGVLNEDFNEKSANLFKTYYPLEISHELTESEKVPIMEEWWTKTHDLLIESGIRREDIKTIASKAELSFRGGFNEIFDHLNKQDIPVLIFSAGLADIIREVLLVKKGNMFMTPNLHIVSNLMKFDKNGTLVGFDGELLHTLNKNAGVLSPYSKFMLQCETRHNVLLIGDNAGDSHMATGLEFDEIIRIGYLNTLVDERLEEYTSRFDVVVLGDGSLSPVKLILDLVSKQQ